jgi:tRNA threonylcarbamoyladenosine biosynthesis protein TsaB
VRILALDTATRATSVALSGADGDEILEARDDRPPGARPRHAARLLPMAADLLDRADLDFSQLDLIAVGIGPGTFTGLRIGLASARALARARGIPLVGVSTLQSLAMNVCEWPERAGLDAVIAVLDARRGEVFAAGWNIGEVDQVTSALFPPSALDPQTLTEMVQRLGLSALAIGDGAIEFRRVLERSGARIPGDLAELHRVTAVNHCRLAAQLEPMDPDQIHPQYLRLPDAEINRRLAGTQ